MPDAKNGRFRDVAIQIAGIAAGLFFVFTIVFQVIFAQEKGDLASILAFVISLALCCVTLIVAHELGHLIAGLALNLPFVAFVVGPLRIFRTNHRLGIHFKWAKTGEAYVLFGNANGRLLKSRRAAMIFAGPLANILIGYYLWGCANTSERLWLPFGSGMTFAFFRFSAVISYYMAVMALIPGYSGRMRNDGGLLLDLMRGVPSTLDPEFLREWFGFPAQLEVDSEFPPDLENGWDADAKRVMLRLREEAYALGDDHIGTNHLLLAAIATLSKEQQVTHDIGYAAVRSALGSSSVRPTACGTTTVFHPTPRLKHAIELAGYRAMSNRRPIDVCDLWFVLLCDPSSESVQVLRRMGHHPEELRKSFAPPWIIAMGSSIAVGQSQLEDAKNKSPHRS